MWEKSIDFRKTVEFCYSGQHLFSGFSCFIYEMVILRNAELIILQMLFSESDSRKRFVAAQEALEAGNGLMHLQRAFPLHAINYFNIFAHFFFKASFSLLYWSILLLSADSTPCTSDSSISLLSCGRLSLSIRNKSWSIRNGDFACASPPLLL